MICVLNPRAGGGAGKKMLRYISCNFPNAVVVSDAEKIDSTMSDRIVLVGGDGTFHVAINRLLGHLKEKTFVFGFIAAGSSNSFMKDASRVHMGRSVRIDFENIYQRDLLFFDFGNTTQAYCLANASIGILAEANDYFNRKNTVVSFFKRYSVGVANTLAFIRTLLSFKPVHAKIQVHGQVVEGQFLTVQMIKSPYFAGDYRFSETVERNDGQALLYAKKYQGKLDALMTFFLMTINKMPQDLLCLPFSQLKIDFIKETVVEADGEIYRSRQLSLDVMKGMMRICG